MVTTATLGKKLLSLKGLMYVVQEDRDPIAVPTFNGSIGASTWGGYENGYGENKHWVEPDSDPSRPHRRELGRLRTAPSINVEGALEQFHIPS